MDDTKLDTLLTAWAKAPVAPGDPEAAADAVLAAPAPARRWWPAVAGGGALAASMVLALFALPGGKTVQPPVTVAAATPVRAPAADEAESYAYQMMFTETPEEEMAI